MNFTDKDSINTIIQNYSLDFLSKKNVIGVAYGNKYVGRVDTGEGCLQVLVENKVSTSNISKQDLIPKEYFGQKTDVIQVGNIKALGLTSKVRPMLFGCSIGPAQMNLAGTAGCLVYDSSNYYILSNNHVMAGENLNPIGTAIVQPGRIDGGVSPRDIVATLSKFIRINYSTSTITAINYVDAAIAKIGNTPNLVSRNIAVIGGIKGTTNATINLQVRKSGRTTGHTTGRILSTNATVNVGYSGGKIALFTNQIVTTAMSAAGDSGSLVVDNNSRAVGLLFAGSSAITILNPINTVLSSLGVKLALN